MENTAHSATERVFLNQRGTEVTCSKLVLFVLSEAVLLMSECTITLATV